MMTQLMCIEYKQCMRRSVWGAEVVKVFGHNTQASAIIAIYKRTFDASGHCSRRRPIVMRTPSVYRSLLAVANPFNLR